MTNVSDTELHEPGGVTQPVSTPASADAPLRLWVHALIGVAIGLISPFTVFAWPFAILLGGAFGASAARRERGERADFAVSLLGALAMAVGILGMLFFGAIIGGLIALPIVFLVSFSEMAAAHASPVDRGVARIILFVIPIAFWLILFPLLGMNLNVNVGG
ncbi:MAG TPA: hypothetical protein VFW95_04750 [Candidatus Limnocylindria bacterium]|nr:hypothetical protein [Candidatus Limnocylindria bacterium]